VARAVVHNREGLMGKALRFHLPFEDPLVRVCVRGGGGGGWEGRG
jgi:hypothetical protein